MSNQFNQILGQMHHIKVGFVWKSCVIGLLAGCLSIGYRFMISYAGDFNRLIYSYISGVDVIGIAAVSTLLALVVGVLIRWEPLSSGSGIPQVEAEVMGQVDANPYKVMVSRFLGGLLSAFGGLSLGRQGPCIQICGSSGKIVSELTRSNESEKLLLITAGASAGLAATFNAPISGTLFALEQVHKKFSHTVMVPAFIAAIVADLLTKYVFGMDPVFQFDSLQSIPLGFYIWLIPLGIFCGFVSMIFNKGLLLGLSLYQRLGIPRYLGPVVPFLVAVGVCLYTPLIRGSGEFLVSVTAEGHFSIQVIVGLLLGKILFTLLCYGSGSHGGIFLPVLVIGGLCGSLYCEVLAYFSFIDKVYVQHFVILGMAGVLTGVVQLPIVSIMLITEMSGNFSSVLASIMVSIVALLISNSLFYSKPIYESLLERLLMGKKAEEGAIHNDPKIVTEYVIGETSSVVGKRLEEISWPHDSLVISIERTGENFVPNGQTEIHGRDRLIILVSKSKLYEVHQWLDEKDELNADWS